MRTFARKTRIAALLAAFAWAGPAAAHRPAHVHAEVYFRAGPVHLAIGPWSPRYVPPPRPGYVWVPGHWHHGRWVPGYWRPVGPAPRGYVWVPGHWRGNTYVEGYWRPARRPGKVWVEGHYDDNGVWIDGYWAPSTPPDIIYVPDNGDEDDEFEPDERGDRYQDDWNDAREWDEDDGGDAGDGHRLRSRDDSRRWSSPEPDDQDTGW